MLESTQASLERLVAARTHGQACDLQRSLIWGLTLLAFGCKFIYFLAISVGGLKSYETCSVVPASLAIPAYSPAHSGQGYCALIEIYSLAVLENLCG